MHLAYIPGYSIKPLQLNWPTSKIFLILKQIVNFFKNLEFILTARGFREF